MTSDPMLDLIRSLTVTAAPVAKPRPAGIPEHVKRILAASGDLDLDTGATTAARLQPCPDCSTWTWIVLVDTQGWTTRLDTRPLSPTGEAIAEILEIPRFRMFDGQRRIVDYRAWSVASRHLTPAGEAEILVQHDCANSHDELDRTRSIIERKRNQPEHYSDIPPF